MSNCSYKVLLILCNRSYAPQSLVGAHLFNDSTLTCAQMSEVI